MNISFFGLGYVGCVGMGCLAQNGHKVIGVDISPEKIKNINEGIPTIVEVGIGEIIKEQHLQGRISATHDYMEAVKESDISFVCVGTPSTNKGHLDLSYIYQTAKEIGEALKEKNGFHVIVIRSTVFPGTNKKVSEIIEGISGKTRNVHFAVVSNPEFLREGTAVKDYMNPPLTVIGTDCEKGTDIMTELYAYGCTPRNSPYRSC